MKTQTLIISLVLTMFIMVNSYSQIISFSQIQFNEIEPIWSRVSYDVNSDNGTTNNGTQGMFSALALSRKILDLEDGTIINFSQLMDDFAFSGLLLERVDYSNGKVLWANSYNSFLEGFEDFGVDAFVNSDGNITILSYEPIMEYSLFSSILLGSIDSYLRIRIFDINTGELLSDSNPREQAVRPHIIPSSFNRVIILNAISDSTYMTSEYHITSRGANGGIEYGEISREVLDSEGKLISNFSYGFDDLLVDFDNGSFAGAAFNKHDLVSPDTLVILYESTKFAVQDSSELSSVVNVVVLDRDLQELSKFTIENNGFPIPIFNTVTTDDTYIYIDSQYASEFPTPQFIGDDNSNVITSVYDYDGNLIFSCDKEFLEKYAAFGVLNKSRERCSLYLGSPDGVSLELLSQEENASAEELSNLTFTSELVDEDFILLPLDLYNIGDNNILVRFFQRKRVNGELEGNWNTWMSFDKSDLGFISSTKDESDSEIAFNVYPNPAGDIINVEFEDILSGSLEIIDMMGMVMMERGIHNEKRFDINTSKLAGGLYSIVVRTGKKELSKKIIILAR